MNVSEFRTILTAFADKPIDVDMDRGKLHCQIREEYIEAKLTYREGNVWVSEDGTTEMTAYRWIINRIARLTLLADKLISQIPNEPFFVTPEGDFLGDLDTSPNGEETRVSDTESAIVDNLREGLAGVSRLLYLTSDAGEGKTTLINHVAREQAKRFKNGECDWLFLPISLGGRPFMALDDIVVAELTNRFRFMLYYDAFTELVKLNAIVPALDGFEEVFLETGSGEAVSALGHLINQLQGSGRVLIAARKAYFEIRSFASQAKMFDSIGDDAGASFERLSLRRWSKDKFLEYCENRGIQDGPRIHHLVAQRLGDTHPLLTRAVLIQRLLDIAEHGGIDDLLDKLGIAPEDYFYKFVDSIIVREANTKWIDRSRRGDFSVPLLSIDEHHLLLGQIAREMWINGTDALRNDYIELIADVFCDEHDKAPNVARQVRERLHHHSLLSATGVGENRLTFDHSDFRLFFLGQALGSELIRAEPQSMAAFLSVSAISPQAADAAVAYVTRKGGNLSKTIDALNKLGGAALVTSYEKENVGLLVIRLLERVDTVEVQVHNTNFPSSSLVARSLKNCIFNNCGFEGTSLSDARLSNVKFLSCTFQRLEIGSNGDFENVCLVDCEVAVVHKIDTDDMVFDPSEIRKELQRAGFGIGSDAEEPSDALERKPVDLETKLAEQALRAFMRSTHLNENVFRQRLGSHANMFIDNVLPVLLRAAVLVEVDYRGGGVQRRFKLNAPMRNIAPAIKSARSLEEFISVLQGDRKR